MISILVSERRKLLVEPNALVNSTQQVAKQTFEGLFMLGLGCGRTLLTE